MSGTCTTTPSTDETSSTTSPSAGSSTYGYDAVGNLARVSEGGIDNLYEYDTRNLLASARMGSGGKTLFGYDADGRRSFVSRPNGVRTDYTYDDASELLSMVHGKGGSVLLGFSYAYDGQGNRVSKTREDGTAEVYGYDASMRLTRVDYGTAKTVAYTLDALGNRTGEAQTVHGASDVTTSYAASFNAFNQLKTRNRSGGGLPAQNVTYNYDNIGNTLNETTASPAAVTSYGWDRDNRLRQVTPPSPRCRRAMRTTHLVCASNVSIAAATLTTCSTAAACSRRARRRARDDDALPQQPTGHRRHAHLHEGRQRLLAPH